jgi:hypothetical protein
LRRVPIDVRRVTGGDKFSLMKKNVDVRAKPFESANVTDFERLFIALFAITFGISLLSSVRSFVSRQNTSTALTTIATNWQEKSVYLLATSQETYISIFLL